MPTCLQPPASQPACAHPSCTLPTLTPQSLYRFFDEHQAAGNLYGKDEKRKPVNLYIPPDSNACNSVGCARCYVWWRCWWPMSYCYCCVCIGGLAAEASAAVLVLPVSMQLRRVQT